jgi:hypothetical protein
MTGSGVTRLFFEAERRICNPPYRLLKALKPYLLTPEGTKIFSGARPKGDDDGQQ